MRPLARSPLAYLCMRGARRLRFRLSYWWKLILAADPGLVRLRMGGRASLTAFLSTVVLYYAARWLGLPVTTAIVGVALAMVASILVNDPSSRQQQFTMLMVAPVAGATLTIGTILAGNHAVSDTILVLVIFVAFFVRGFGPRAMALGMVAFWGYFYAIFFHAKIEQLPWMVAAIGVAIAIAFVLRFSLLKDSPSTIFDATLRAFRARVQVLLADLATLAAACRPQSHMMRRLQKSIAKLNETALALEDQAGASRIRFDDEVSSWRSSLFAVELALRALVEAFREITSSAEALPDRRQLSRIAQGLRLFVERECPQARERVLYQLQTLSTNPSRNKPVLQLPYLRLQVAASRLMANQPWQTAAAIAARHRAEQPPASVSGQSGTSAITAKQLKSGLSQSIQAAAGGAGALLVGHGISATRWYWAVIAAFVVFIRTTTVGDIMLRAWQRTVGTIAGVAAGLVVAELARGHQKVELALIFLCIFGAYYFLREEYALMVAFITSVLALLYNLLGMYSPALLLLRTEETLAGAAIALLAASILFPTRTSTKVRAQIADVLRSGGALLAEESARCPPSSKLEIMGKVRVIDQQMQGLWQSAAPATSTGFSSAAQEITRHVHDVSVFSYCVRQIVMAETVQVASAFRTQVANAARRLGANAKMVAHALESLERRPLSNTAPAIRQLRALAAESHSGEELLVVEWLNRIDLILTDIAHTLGIAPKAKQVIQGSVSTV